MKTITIKVKVPQTEEEAHEMTKKDGDELVEECADKFMEVCDSYEDPEQFKKDLSGMGELVLLLEKLSEEEKLTIANLPLIIFRFDEIDRATKKKAIKHIIKEIFGGLLDD